MVNEDVCALHWLRNVMTSLLLSDAPTLQL